MKSIELVFANTVKGFSAWRKRLREGLEICGLAASIEQPSKVPLMRMKLSPRLKRTLQKLTIYQNLQADELT